MVLLFRRRRGEAPNGVGWSPNHVQFPTTDIISVGCAVVTGDICIEHDQTMELREQHRDRS